jgi:hypothetical protein
MKVHLGVEGAGLVVNGASGKMMTKERKVAA